MGAQASFPLTAEPKTTPVSILVDPGCYTAQEGDATGWINNNLNFVQGPGVCPVPALFTYTDETAPACP